MSAEGQGVPDIPVRADDLGETADLLTWRAGALVAMADDVVAPWSGLRHSYDTPDAADLVERMSRLVGADAEVSDAFVRVGDVLGELAGALRILEMRRAHLVDESASAREAPQEPGGDVGRADELGRSISRLRADVDAVLDIACRDLAALGAPPPRALAQGAGVPPLIGPSVTWQSRTDDLARDALLAPLVELARGGAGRVRGLLAAHPDWAERLRQRPPSPDAVQKWWSRLPPGTRTALLNGAPAVVGALGGVPPLSRVAANRIVARDRLPSVDQEIARYEALDHEGAAATLQVERQRALGRLRAERDYLSRVADGDVQLVLYEPDDNRIVEMLGTPGPDTRRVLTYVPGTFTSVDSFYRGEVQELPQWLRRQDEAMVAFVWKGTVFPGEAGSAGLTDQLGGIWEANEQHRARPAGASLARFALEIRSDTDVASARQIGAGYSWGLVPLTSSELSGASYDSVQSFAGAWVPEGWRANPATTYAHWSYTDFLSMAQDAGLVGHGRNPDVMPGFESRIYDRPGDFDVPLTSGLTPFLNPDGPSVRISSDAFENHQLIVSSRPQNRLALDDIRDAVLEEGE